jgi:transposase
VLRPVEKFEMRQFREAGMSIKDCAIYFQVSLATTMRGLAEMREKFGPEKLPATRRHLARSHLAMSQIPTSNHE